MCSSPVNEAMQAEETVSRPRLWIVYLCVLGVLLIAGAAAFWYVGRWLVVEDPLQPAQAIVVLSGSMPDRAIEASRIYQQKMAPQVWVSQGLSPAAQLARMNIAFLGEDFYSQKVLMALGVPVLAIHILEDPAANTEEEVDEIARELKRQNAHTVIVVTSKPHTRRVRYIWKRRIGGDPRIIVRYPNDDSFDAAHWWRRTQDALDVVREVLGLANAMAGFPLRPAVH
jgi:uncharacterized SAM-binding protein YcdF (DUF218 family)